MQQRPSSLGTIDITMDLLPLEQAHDWRPVLPRGRGVAFETSQM